MFVKTGFPILYIPQCAQALTYLFSWPPPRPCPGAGGRWQRRWAPSSCRRSPLWSAWRNPRTQISSPVLRQVAVCRCHYANVISYSMGWNGVIIEHCRLLENWNLMLIFFWLTALHVSIFTVYVRWFKEEGWTYFCRFVFVCFTLEYKLHEKLRFNDLLKI